LAGCKHQEIALNEAKIECPHAHGGPSRQWRVWKAPKRSA
jgi:hypothetical protein